MCAKTPLFFSGHYSSALMNPFSPLLLFKSEQGTLAVFYPTQTNSHFQHLTCEARSLERWLYFYKMLCTIHAPSNTAAVMIITANLSLTKNVLPEIPDRNVKTEECIYSYQSCRLLQGSGGRYIGYNQLQLSQ